MNALLNQTAARRFIDVFDPTLGLTASCEVSCPQECVTLVDCGIRPRGSVSLGIWLAEICMGGQGRCQIRSGSDPFPGPIVEVQTDAPVAACLGSQYAGWPLKASKFFAMASGPMRACRGREPVLERIGCHEPVMDAIVGVLESDQLPTEEAMQKIIDECHAEGKRLYLAVAPTKSIAGTIQVVARSAETAMHKLDEVGFDVRQVISALGAAPLPAPAIDSLVGIGRTNDAILYGGRVTLWVDAEPQEVDRVGPIIPSSASRDFGKPFGEIFKAYDYDFYKIDPHLFSPAEITIINLRDGLTKTFGKTHPEIYLQSP